jgi:hypothetical protein
VCAEAIPCNRLTASAEAGLARGEHAR